MKKLVATILGLVLTNILHAATYVYNVPVAYPTVQAAVNAVPANSSDSYIIQIAPGSYNEAVSINSGQNNITFIGTGASRTNTVIWNNVLNATDPYTGALKINGNDITVKNLTLQNTAGPTAGQAGALNCSGQRICFKNVLVSGYQDTALISGGPNYFCNSEIAGSVDFIWYGGTAYFENCTIRQLVGGGDNTAPSTASNVLYGFVFTNCYIAKAAGVAANSSGLMRPYGANGETAYLGCTMDDHITAAGWDAWNGNELTCRAAEYMSYTTNGTLIDLSTRSSWVVRLTAAQAAAYGKTNVLGGWNPPVSPTSYDGPPLPVIPTNRFIVTSYGAVGNGSGDNTVAIQNAINAAGVAGGGTVEIPAASGTYLCGPLNMSNSVNLQIDSGAILQMLPYGTYPSSGQNFISGTSLHDVEISGGGMIDGQGQAWWTAFQNNSSLARPEMISMSRCSPVEVQGIVLSNSPMFFIAFGNANNSTIEGVTIKAPSNSPNTDACDITGANTLVENCNISNGDDDFTCEGGTRNVMIRNTAFGTGHGCSIGSYTDQGGVSNLTVTSCSFTGTGNGIRIKTARDRGGEVQHLTYSNLSMTNVDSPIFISEYYPDSSIPSDPATDTGSTITATTPIFHDILISNVTAVGTSAGNYYGIYGIPEMQVSNVVLANVVISYGPKTFACYNVHDIAMVDTAFGAANGANDISPYQSNLTFTNSTFNTNPMTLGSPTTSQANNSLLLYNGLASSSAGNLFTANPILTVSDGRLSLTNNLVLNTASTTSFGCGSNAAEVDVTGNLTVAGTINIADAGGFIAGTYTLFTYGGTLTMSSPSLGFTPAGFTCSLDTSTAGQVKLIASTGAAPPPPPTGLTAVGGNAVVNLSWIQSTGNGLLQNKVYRSTTNGGPYTLLATIAPAATYSDNTALNGVTYWYVVSAVTINGESSYSTQASATPSGPPAAPSGVTAIGSNGQVTVNWASAFGATSYNVKRSSVSGGPYYVTITNVSATGFVDAGVVNGTIYYYVVSAVNALGEGPNSSEVNATPLPWQTQDVGSVGIAGNVAFTNGIYTVTGSGADIQSTADAFRYLYLPASGDCTVIARVATVQNVNAWSKAGVMIRESLTANAANAFVGVTPSNGVTWQYRTNTAGNTTYNNTTGIHAPFWVKLVRSGNTFTGYRSADGVNWTQQGTGTVTMATNEYVGLVVCSHDNTALCTATFDNVTMPTPPSTTPPTPTGVTAAPGNMQVSLTWNASSGATSYNVKRATVSSGPYTTIASPTSPSYVDTGLVNGTTYYYMVSAVNGSGQSADSGVVSATPVPPPATPPTGLTATAGNAQVALSWTADSGATSFNVKRATVSGGPYMTVTNVTTTSYTDTGLVNGTTYYYVVSGVNAGGESGNSTQVSATPQLPPPDAPSSISANPGNAQIAVSWAASSLAASYNLKRATMNGGPYTIITNIAATTYTDSGLVNGTTYYYVVSSVNSSGESANSSQAAATPQAPPGSPAGLTATAGLNQVSLNWTVPTGVIGYYNIKRSATSGGPYATINTTTLPSYVDTSVSGGTTYYYVVTAANVGGESAASNEASATASNGWMPPWQTQDIGTVGVVGSASYAGGVFTVAGSGADITGTADAFRYVYMTNTGDCTIVARVASVQNVNAWSKAGVMIRESLATNAANALIAVTPGNGVTWQYRSSTGGGTSFNNTTALVAPYWVKMVRAGNVFTAYRSPDGVTWTQQGTATFTIASTAYIGLAVSSHNNTSLCTATFDNVTAPNWPPAGGAPPVPSGVIATAGNAQVTLNWTASSGAVSYNVKRGTINGGPYTTIAGPTGTSFTDTSVDNGTTYYYVITAVSLSGESSNSSQVSAMPQASSSPPATPTGVVATAGNGQINLGWSASTGATSYSVKRAIVNGGPYTTITNIATTSYNDASVVNGTTYYYVVSAVNGSGESANSSQVSATPVAPPTAPTGLAATAGNAQVGLSWTASSGATSYNVKRASVNGGPYTTITNVTTTGFTDTGLANGTICYYVVSALNAGGESANSTQASATPQVPPPAAPTGLNATAGNAQVALNWTASSGATSYNVKRSTTSGGPYTTITNVTTTSYTDTGLVNGTTYYYVVSALNAGGESANSTQASATPNTPPPAPTGLTATAGTNQVVLNWTASSGATSYNVKRATVSGGPYTTIASPATTSFVDTNATAPTTYYYVVSAVGAGGESANSAEVSVTPFSGLPSPWVSQDIGTVGTAGSASYGSGTFTINGAGAAIGSTADAFQFVYQPSSGNCTNTVRVATIQNTGTAAKAGVMIRDTLNANAMEAGVWVTPSSIVFTYRTSTGGATTTKTSNSKTAPYWVRITRSSNSFSAYYSSNGTSWTQLGATQTISMGTSAYIGMGVCSGATNTLNTATIDNVTALP